MLLRGDNRLLVFFEILKTVLGPVAMDIFSNEVHESYRGQDADINWILNFGKIPRNSENKWLQNTHVKIAWKNFPCKNGLKIPM